MGMIVEQPSPSTGRNGLEAVHAVLRPVLGADGARDRREAVLAADPREDAELSSLFLELDGLIEALRLRLQSFEPPPVPPPRPPRKVTPAMEIGAPDTDRGQVDLEDIDALQVPPLPEVAAEAEPPPLPPPPVPTPARELGVIPAVAADTPAVNLLYDDIVWLVSIDDWAGALISLERLLVMARIDGQIKEFVDVNEVKLLNVYESYLGPFSKVPTVKSRDIDNAMPAAYERAEKIHAVIELIDGARSLTELMRDSTFTPRAAKTTIIW